MRRAASRIATVSSGTIGRPSYSWPPATMCTWPRTMSARSSGQSMKGGRLALAGKPIRNAPTRCKCAPLDHGVGEMGGADHDRGDSGRDRGLRQQFGQGGAHAAQYVGGGGGFDRDQDVGAVNQHGIRVGATDIDADAPHGLLREHRYVVGIVAEGARADMLDAFRCSQDGGRGQGNHADPLAIAQALGADRLAGDAVEHADQIRAW